MAQHLLARSAQFFREMLEQRQACLSSRQFGDSTSSDGLLAAIDARLARPAPLPSLSSALAARRAIVGPHEAA